MAELEGRDLAEVVAVDLVGERAVALHPQRGQVGPVVEVELVAPQPLARPEGRPPEAERSWRTRGTAPTPWPGRCRASCPAPRSPGACRGRCTGSCSGRCRSRRRRPHRRSAGARRTAAGSGRSRGTTSRTPANTKSGWLAYRLSTTAARRGRRRPRRIPCRRGRGSCGRSRPTQPDAADRLTGQRLEQHGGGLDGVVGQAERAGEDVGRPAGQRRPCAVSVPASPLAASFSVPSPPSTTTTSLPSAAGALRQPGGVAPTAGLGQRDLVVGRQRLLDHRPASRAVTDEAEEFTSRRTSTAGGP